MQVKPLFSDSKCAFESHQGHRIKTRSYLVFYEVGRVFSCVVVFAFPLISSSQDFCGTSLTCAAEVLNQWLHLAPPGAQVPSKSRMRSVSAVCRPLASPDLRDYLDLPFTRRPFFQ